MMQPIIKTFNDLTTYELYEILKVRFEVFVMEQHCSYLDLDDVDYRSFHFFIMEGKRIRAYARMFAEDEPCVWHVGRVLTTLRNKGLGTAILQEVFRQAKVVGADILRLEAQVQAEPFYKRLGFIETSEPFEEAGIPHIKMQKILNTPSL